VTPTDVPDGVSPETELPEPPPVPRRIGPPIALGIGQKSKPTEVGPTEDERLMSEIVAMAKSADPELWAVIDLARAPLPPLAHAEQVLATAAEAESTEAEAEIDRLAAADVAALAAAKPTKVPVRFVFEPRAVAASGDGTTEVWRVTSNSFCVLPVTASAGGPPPRSELGGAGAKAARGSGQRGRIRWHVASERLVL
jgi:hypothetical protein